MSATVLLFSATVPQVAKCVTTGSPYIFDLGLLVRPELSTSTVSVPAQTCVNDEPLSNIMYSDAARQGNNKESTRLQRYTNRN